MTRSPTFVQLFTWIYLRATNISGLDKDRKPATCQRYPPFAMMIFFSWIIKFNSILAFTALAGEAYPWVYNPVGEKRDKDPGHTKTLSLPFNFMCMGWVFGIQVLYIITTYSIHYLIRMRNKKLILLNILNIIIAGWGNKY